MKYDITKSHSPKMPVLEKGTECIQILLKQISKDMNQPLVPMLFPILGAHFTETGFCLRDRIWMELGRIVDDLVEEDVCVDNKNHKAALS